MRENREQVRHHHIELRRVEPKRQPEQALNDLLHSEQQWDRRERNLRLSPRLAQCRHAQDGQCSASYEASSRRETHVVSSIYPSAIRSTTVDDGHSQPLRKPARRSPETTYGHARINRQRKSER